MIEYNSNLEKIINTPRFMLKCLKMQDKIRLKKDQIIKFGKVLDTPKEYLYETDEKLGSSSNLPVATSVKRLSKFQQIIQALKDIILG